MSLLQNFRVEVEKDCGEDEVPMRVALIGHLGREVILLEEDKYIEWVTALGT